MQSVLFIQQGYDYVIPGGLSFGIHFEEVFQRSLIASQKRHVPQGREDFVTSLTYPLKCLPNAIATISSAKPKISLYQAFEKGGMARMNQTPNRFVHEIMVPKSTLSLSPNPADPTHPPKSGKLRKPNQKTANCRSRESCWLISLTLSQP